MPEQTRCLVVYYSYEGNTRAVAQAIAEEIRHNGGAANLLEVKPVDEIEAKGLGKYVWGGRRVVMNRAPELQPYTLDAMDYDLIFVGTPVWVQSMAPPIKAYLAQTSLRDKAVALFCTHGGGRGWCLKRMRSAAAGADTLGVADFANVLQQEQASIDKARAWARQMLQILTRTA